MHTAAQLPHVCRVCGCRLRALQVRVLLSSGGQYEELSSGSSGDGGGKGGRWRYVGGETRLVGLSR